MHRIPLMAALVLVVPAGAVAQDIPPYVPANPLIESRSALYGQPFISPRHGWGVRLVTDYYNAVEVSQSAGSAPRQSTFDAEVLQADLWLTRDVSRRIFVLANVPVRGGYSGFLDGFLIWYHHFINLPVPARDELPRNTFRWSVALPDTTVERARPGTFVGDARAGMGVRLGRAQVIGTVTLPTATLGSDGWTRHVVGGSLALVADLVRTSRVVVDANGSIGLTPTNGRLARYQRSAFVAGMVTGRWRFIGQQALFFGVWTQSSNWKGTGFDAVDDVEAVMDYGFLLHLNRRWPELQLGMTEDLIPRGPAMDVGFTVGLRW